MEDKKTCKCKTKSGISIFYRNMGIIEDWNEGNALILVDFIFSLRVCFFKKRQKTLYINLTKFLQKRTLTRQKRPYSMRNSSIPRFILICSICQ